MKNFIVALVVLASAASTAYSYHDWNINFSYNTGMPTSNLGEYIDRYSWVGFSGHIQYRTDDFNYFGIYSGWQRFDALYRDRTEMFANGAVYGSQVRIVSAVPLLLTATHNLADPIDRVQPYMTLGAGMYFMTQWMEIGMYSFENGTTHFGLMPGLGLKFRLDRQTSMDLQVDYNAAFDSGETLGGQDDNSYSWVGIKLGFTFGQ